MGCNESGTEARRFFMTRAAMTPVKGQIQPNFTAAYGSGYTVVVTPWSWAESPEMRKCSYSEVLSFPLVMSAKDE